MKNWKKFSRSTSVYFPRKKNNYLFLSKKDTAFIKKKDNLVKLKSRICSHLKPGDKIHEMLIFHKKDAYVRPHRHINKIESFCLISGKANLILFNNNGVPFKVVKLGEYSSGNKFYYKIYKSCFHTLIIEKNLLFLEVTSGPYKKNKTIPAQWSPIENNKKEVKKYLLKLKKLTKLL